MVHQCHETCFFFNSDNILGADLCDGPYVAPNLIVTEHTTFYSIHVFHVPLLLNTWYYREGYVYIPSFFQPTAPTGTLTC